MKLKRIFKLFRQKRIYIVLCIAVFLSIACFLRILDSNQFYTYDGKRCFDNGEIQTEVVLYEAISLPLGVYKIQLDYLTNTNNENHCTVKDGSVFRGGLLTNGTCLYQELGQTSFMIWLFENTETLQVTLSYNGNGYVTTGNLTIQETDTLWTMCLAIIWSVALALIGIFVLSSYDKNVGIEKENKVVFFGLSIVVLIASLPYLYGGNLVAGDIGYHLMRIEGVKDGILSRQFPLRIEPEWLYGHGYASGIFYCNTLLYFPAVLRLIGFPVATCYNLFCIMLNIGTVLISYYCFAKIFENRYIGLMCSALYTLSIYRIAKMVITGAVGEACAVMFMPLIIYGMYKTFSGNVTANDYKRSWIPIAVGYAGLIQSHVLSCEIAAFLTVIICIFFIKKIFVKQIFWELFKGAAAAIIISFWFLVPFLDYYISEDVHIHNVSARTIQERGLYLPQLFFNWWKKGSNVLYGDLGMVEAQAMGVGLVLGIGSVVFCILWFNGKWRENKQPIIVLGKYMCVISGGLMIMSLNFFPWDYIQHMNGITMSLVSSLQFPNRFLGWGTVFLVTVFGSILWYWTKEGKRWEYYLMSICVLIGIATSSIYLTDYTNKAAEWVYVYNEEGMGAGYISGGEYVIEGTNADSLCYNNPSASEHVSISSYNKEYLHMWVECENMGNKEGYIELPLLHYKGYRAYVPALRDELKTEKGTNNVVRVLLPSGFKGQVEVKFVSPVYWRVSEAITYIWWIFIIIYAICKKYKNQKEKKNEIAV